MATNANGQTRAESLWRAELQTSAETGKLQKQWKNNLFGMSGANSASDEAVCTKASKVWEIPSQEVLLPDGAASVEKPVQCYVGSEDVVHDLAHPEEDAQ